MREVEDMIDVLERVPALALKVSIDDFGTGCSSFSYLRRFPIDEIEFDQAFVREIRTIEIYCRKRGAAGGAAARMAVTSAQGAIAFRLSLPCPFDASHDSV